MSADAQRLPELDTLTHRWSEAMDRSSGHRHRIAYFQEQLPRLLFNKNIFLSLLQNISRGRPYPDLRSTTMFDNEILLYLDAQRRFSLRLYLFGPNEYTPIHDHNSWGVTGTVSPCLEVVKYHRLDDGQRSDYAELAEHERLQLGPGATDVTLPLNQGIHKTGNPTQQTILMVSIYGSPIRRLYVNGFEPNARRVFKIYAPRIKKRLMAQALVNIL